MISIGWKTYTKEEREAARAARKDEVDALCSSLEDAVEKLRDTDRYKEYLRVMSKFHDYSFRNTLLILQQMPNATLVASFSAWKKVGRRVKKGEHGIRILAPITYPAKRSVPDVDSTTGLVARGPDGKPAEVEKTVRVAGFRAVSVFDISQTEGRELPAVVEELTGSVNDYERLFNAIKDASGLRVLHGPLEGKTWGLCDIANKVVILREGISEAQSIKTLIHEIAHYRMHPPGNSLPRALREIQAESVAYVVAAHFGLDTSDYSLGYLDSWASSTTNPELKSSLDTIARNASTLIEQIEEQLEHTRETTRSEDMPSLHGKLPGRHERNDGDER